MSQVELITKCPESLSGVRYRIDGGAEKELEDVGAPDGTTFLVRNLFYNTPARRKFLKTPATEAGYVSSVMEHLCMSHPDISFRFINNNQPKLQTVGNGLIEEADRVYSVNSLLEALQLDSYEPCEVCGEPQLAEILDSILDYACKNGICDDSIVYL